MILIQFNLAKLPHLTYVVLFSPVLKNQNFLNLYFCNYFDFYFLKYFDYQFFYTSISIINLKKKLI